MKKLEEMTLNERILRKIVVGIRNDYIGGIENMILDYSEEEIKEYFPNGFPTRDDVVEYIYKEVMNGKEEYITAPNDIISLEKRHIHFMGEQFVREMIENRVDFDIKKNGWSWL